MECNSCGRSSENNKANFCEYCGSSFREGVIYQPSKLASEKKEVEKTQEVISFWNWLGSMAIIFIPTFGIFIFVGLLINWSIKKDMNESKKTWAKAMLVFLAISLIILMWFINYLASPGGLALLQEMQNIIPVQ